MRLSIQYHPVFSGILLGFLIYGLKFLAGEFFHPLQGLFALTGLILIFFTPFFFKFKVIIPLKGFVQFAFYFYLIWSFIIIVRPIIVGESYSINSLHPYATYGILSYLLPLIILLGIGIISLPKLFKIINIFIFIGFIYFILNFKNMQAIVSEGILNASEDSDSIGINDLESQYGFWLSTSLFSLICYEFTTKKQKWLAISATALMFFLALYFARRGEIVIYSGYFLATFYLYLLQNNGGTKILKILFILLILGTVTLTVMMYSESTFSLLFSRIGEDSRSGVDEALILYLNNENAWFFGKGIEGVYSYSGFEAPRYIHETGYLHMILKGGVVYLCLYCFLLLHSAYLGFFKTNNRLTKALAINLLFHVLMLIPFGVIHFNLEYLFVWIAVALCQFDKYRLMTDQQIKHHLALSK